MRQFFSPHFLCDDFRPFLRYAKGQDMLEQKYRFHGYGSLRYVYRNGRSLRSRHLTIRYVQNTQRIDSRATVIVAKKVIKAAPKRNRIRRRLYEALRDIWPQINSSHDIVITVHSPELLVAPFSEIHSELTRALASAHILKSGK